MLRSISITLGALALFVLVTFLVSPDTLTQYLSVAVFVAAGFAVLRWGGAAARVFAKGSRDTTAWGVLGLVLMLLAEEGRRIFSIVYLQLGRPEWMIVVPITPFLVYLTFAGILLIILATRIDGERPAQFPTIVTAILVFVCLMLSSLGGIVIKQLVALFGYATRALF